MLWETYPNDWRNWIPNVSVKSPTITVVNEAWQSEKCAMLELSILAICRHPDQLIDEPLSKYQPWDTESIVSDCERLSQAIKTSILDLVE